MPDLLDRLIGNNLGPTDVKLSVHAFMSALAEYKRGAVTQAQIVSAFGLSGAEATQLDVFLAQLDLDAINRAAIHDALLLGEEGHYPKATVKSRLGV